MTTSTHEDNEWDKRAGEAGEHAERTAGGRAKYREFVESVKTLVEMLRDHRAGTFKLSMSEIAILIATLAYVVNPADAVPEAVLGPVGLGDDVTAMGVAVGLLAGAIARYRTGTATGAARS